MCLHVKLSFVLARHVRHGWPLELCPAGEGGGDCDGGQGTASDHSARPPRPGDAGARRSHGRQRQQLFITVAKESLVSVRAERGGELRQRESKASEESCARLPPPNPSAADKAAMQHDTATWCARTVTTDGILHTVVFLFFFIKIVFQAN
jgi:hypothetical protein